jgi:hypothetical protein
MSYSESPSSFQTGPSRRPAIEDALAGCASADSLVGTYGNGCMVRTGTVESPAVLDGAGNAGASRDDPSATKPTKRVRIPDPEGVMLIWARIKRRRAAKAAASLPATEDHKSAPPSASPR